MLTRKLVLRIPLCLLSAPLAASVRESCAVTIAQLRAVVGQPAWPLGWAETTMQDGLPLLVSIQEADGLLALSFVKTGAGMWAEGSCAVCREGDTLVARFKAGQVRGGPAAPWILRQSLKAGATFTLRLAGAQRLQIATAGWSGDFVPMTA